MAQYIPKDVLIAKIENLENTYKNCPTRNIYEEGLKKGRLIGYKDALYKIDSVEVKEGDLEKEFDDYTKDIMACDVQFEPFTHMYNCAKHFFELGIFSQLTWQDIRLISEIGEDFMNSEESDNLSEEEYYTAILNKLKKKGRDYETNGQRIRNLTQKGE